jgi:hypothetical protein
MKLLRETIRISILEMFGGGARQNLDSGDFKDDIDYNFAQYAVNEKPLYLSTEDKEHAKVEYGGLDGVQGGVIYSGGRINSEEQLEALRKIENGGSTNINMKSYSHRKATARSFADFVMTYDPVAGGRAMKAAMERGSAGEFGSYLITIEANENTIIINTRKQNGVTRSVEDELIVDGNVNVIGVDIIAPMQKDSWTQQTIEEWDELKDLDGAQFLGAWLQHHRIDPWQGGHLEEYLDEMTSSIDGLVELLVEYRNVRILKLNQGKYMEWLSDHPLANKLIDKVELKKETSGVGIDTKINGENVYLGSELKARAIAEKGMSLLEESYQEAKSKLEADMEKMLGNISEESLGMDKKFGYRSVMAFTYVRQFVFVLETMSKLGILEYKHTRPIEHFQGWMEEITEIGLTQTNWKEHKSVLQDVPKVSEWKSMMDFLEDKADSDLALDLVLKDYLRMIYQSANNYREINKWENNEEFLRELPDMLRKAVGAMT